ncbi:MAG: SelT/SelW/SelH family protein, partial [Verrucomicrobiota bacterium]|nr:SelT/SelW/SelH family protein [Verrucomicrobiota bacterium]
MKSSKTQAEAHLVIEYCPGCRWLLRSSWMAQEVLTTFETEIEQVSLRPCKTEAGRFRITLGQQLIWCRKRNGGFPEIKILKQSIRDCIAPQKDLGHS